MCCLCVHHIVACRLSSGPPIGLRTPPVGPKHVREPVRHFKRTVIAVIVL